jgi:hypothetical protein
MSRAPVSFKERDVIRVVKAIRKAGLKIKLVEIDKSGRIGVTTENGEDAEAPQDRNQWDKALGHEAR